VLRAHCDLTADCQEKVLSGVTTVKAPTDRSLVLSPGSLDSLLLLARDGTVDTSGAVARVPSYTLNTHATSDLAPSSPHKRFDVVLSYNLLHDLVRTVSSHREPETQTAHNVTEADQSAGLDRRITWNRA